MFEMLRSRRSGAVERKASDREPNVDTTTLAFTGRVAYWSARHRWWVVAASVFVLVMAMFVSSTVETKELDYDGEGEAADASDLVNERFDFDTAPTEQLVFSNPSLDANNPAYRQAVDDLIGQLRALPEVASAVSYYDTQAAGMVSEDGHVVLARVEIDTSTGDAEDKIGVILDTVHAANASADGFEIAIAGNTSLISELSRIDEEDFAIMIVATMVLALVFMLIAFRAVVAAAMPLVLAIGSIFTAIGVATLVSHVYPMVDFLAQVVLLMGMAVGVDYSLFIVSRYRNERAAGRPKLEAIAVASSTTGRAVFYAGITVVLSLVGLFLTNSAIFISMSAGIIIVVLLALLGSLTLIPALLGILGDNINRLRLPIIGRETQGPSTGGIWGAITDRVLARPGILATVTTAALIAVAVPVVSLDIGFPGGSKSLHDAVEGKRALQLLEEHFTAGLTQPAYVVVDASDVNSPEVQASVARLIEEVDRDGAFVPPYDVEVRLGQRPPLRAGAR
jgi:RND superfamily putative drug exporter